MKSYFKSLSLLGAFFFVNSQHAQEALPFKDARIDIFMRDSALHGIGPSRSNEILGPKEFLILTVDGSIRAIGRVSSGADDYRYKYKAPHPKAGQPKNTATRARRWQLFGIKNHKYQWVKTPDGGSKKESAMPGSFLLSPYNRIDYFGACIHGTYNYGYTEFGYPASHGCLRCVTLEDGKGPWNSDGLNPILWRHLIPYRLKNLTESSGDGTDIIDDAQNTKDKARWENFYQENDEDFLTMRKLNKRIRIFTHSKDSLSKIKNWKKSLESMYPANLIKFAIGARSTLSDEMWHEFKAGEHKVNERLLRKVQEVEDKVYPKLEAYYPPRLESRMRNLEKDSPRILKAIPYRP